MNVLHKVLCEIAEADHADQYIDTLKGVRESMTKMIKDFDATMAVMQKGSDRHKKLKKKRDEMASFLDGFETELQQDPLAKRKGF